MGECDYASERFFESYERLWLFHLRASDNSQFVNNSSHSASHHPDSNKGPIQESTISERCVALTPLRFSLTPVHRIDILFPEQPRGSNDKAMSSKQHKVS
jgi:hypothetical protein